MFSCFLLLSGHISMSAARSALGVHGLPTNTPLTELAVLMSVCVCVCRCSAET